MKLALQKVQSSEACLLSGHTGLEAVTEMVTDCQTDTNCQT